MIHFESTDGGKSVYTVYKDNSVNDYFLPTNHPSAAPTAEYVWRSNEGYILFTHKPISSPDTFAAHLLHQLGVGQPMGFTSNGILWTRHSSSFIELSHPTGSQNSPPKVHRGAQLMWPNLRLGIPQHHDVILEDEQEQIQICHPQKGRPAFVQLPPSWLRLPIKDSTLIIPLTGKLAGTIQFSLQLHYDQIVSIPLLNSGGHQLNRTGSNLFNFCLDPLQPITAVSGTEPTGRSFIKLQQDGDAPFIEDIEPAPEMREPQPPLDVRQHLMQHEGWQDAGERRLGNRRPDLIKTEGDRTMYAELGEFIRDGRPVKAKRDVLADQLQELQQQERIFFIDKNDAKRRIIYQPGDDVETKGLEG
ncbi:MAG: hypothetical protein AAF702_15920 [Chloroflexota bacterium]